MRRFDRVGFSVLAAPRRSYRGLLACSVAVGATLVASQAMALNVANQTDWNTAVAAVAAAGSGSTVSINVTSGFTLSSSLAQLQTSNANVTVNITGNSQTINGASAYQGIQVNGANAPTVNISNLTITATQATGGTGANGQNGYYSGGLSYGSGGGGGGGLGAGGGLFVGSGANVTLASVTFTGNNATGGAGGAGGSAQNTASSGTGGNGGAGGALNGGATVGGGGAGGSGGNTGTQGTAGTAGGTVGAGGGGGGGSGTTNSTSYTGNNVGGSGATAGHGGSGGDGVTNNQGTQGPGADGGSGGSGGSGQGGAIYVGFDAILTIVDTPISGATVTGGGGGTNGVGQGPSSVNGAPGSAGSTAGQGIYVNGGNANIGVSTGTVTYANIISGSSDGGPALNKTGAGALALTGANNYLGGTMLTGGTLVVGNSAALGNSSSYLLMAAGTTLSFAGGNFTVPNPITVSGDPNFTPALGTTQTLSGVISNGTAPGEVNMQGPGALVLTAANTYSGGTVVSGGVLQMSGVGKLGATTGTLAVSGGALDLGGAAQTTGALTLTGGTIQNGTLTSSAFNAQSGTISAVLAGGGKLTQNGIGTTFLSGLNTYTGGTTVLSGVLQLSGSGTLGAAAGALTVSGGTLNLGGTTQTVGTLTLNGGTVQNGALSSTAITSSGGTLNGVSGSTSVTITGGTTILTGTNTYTGGTTVNGGILNVTGSLADPTINSGGELMGTGSVGASQINSGGILMPGDGTAASSLTFTGPLTLASGAIYRVNLNPTTSSFAAVTGAATLGGASVNAVFANGSYVVKKYTILTATTGVAGTFAPTVASTNLPSGFVSTLSYDANDVYLNLGLNFGIPGGLNRNQQAVGGALTRSFNTAGGIPMLYGGLTASQLSQASGELATGAQQTTFDAMGQFMGLMQTNGAQGEASSNPTKRLNVWAAGIGRSRTTDGNATTGSNNTTDSVYGGAAGADYAISPDTVAGVALAEGETRFSVATAGSGSSTLFQAGAYVRHTIGAAYISGALAYGWQDITTNRTVTISGADQLRAEYDATAYSGRVEAGYRLLSRWTGVTPYAALQYTVFDQPGYSERAVAGSTNFALAYAGKDLTDTRSELGLRTDNAFARADGAVTLGTSLAWVHDEDPNHAATASFQALPASSFSVYGAAQSPDAALTTVSIGRKWASGWSVSAGFEGEFSSLADSYAGRGVIRYAW